jgi:serine/threonine protein kinase
MAVQTPPELLESQIVSRKTDVYAYAVVLWEIIMRSLPYIGLIAYM